MDYFTTLAALLKMEREEDRAQYQRLAETTSLTQRRAGGLTWYPVVIRDTEMSRGDYLTVEIERTTYQDLPHQFRFGTTAVLFSQHDPSHDRVEGIVSYQGGDRLKLTLRTDELPDWSRDGKLGVDLLFDDNSYTEMFSALRQAAALYEKGEEGRLVKILVGEHSPTFHQEEAAPHGRLNTAQQAAVEKILAANELSIIHGPPGTGKTTTLVKAIQALVQRDKDKVLVTAPSNTAVDLLSERLSYTGLNVLRVGNPARVSSRLNALTLDSRMAAHPTMKEIKRLKKQAAEYRDMAHKYKRNFGKAERDQRKALFDEARNILKEVERAEQFILEDLLAKTQVVAATLVGANHYTVRGLRYGTVVIDEAGQAPEPACWIPIIKAPRLVLAGDHCQLPPTILSDEAARKGLSTTLLEKCVALHPGTVTLLEEQYRMNTAIMEYSSSYFYEGRLKAHASVADWVLLPEERPFVFVDTAGCGYEEKNEEGGISNPEEAAFVAGMVSRLIQRLLEDHHIDPARLPTVGVISPYRYQVNVLRDLLLPRLSGMEDSLSVNTIDSFQGQERDLIFISLTRSNADNRIGFLSEIRRMNVAMTRARKKLVIVGDSATLSQSPFYAGLIAHAEATGAYASAWDLMYE